MAKEAAFADVDIAAAQFERRIWPDAIDRLMQRLEAGTPGWKTEVELCSALTGEGVHRIWERVELFYRVLDEKGIIAKRRQEQALDWLERTVQRGRWVHVLGIYPPLRSLHAEPRFHALLKKMRLEE